MIHGPRIDTMLTRPTEAKVFEDLAQLYLTWCTLCRYESVVLSREGLPPNKLHEILNYVFRCVEEAYVSCAQRRERHISAPPVLTRVDR